MHIKEVILKVTSTLVLLLLFSLRVVSQDDRKSQPVRLMFYNVENLFDIYDDSLKDDDDFLPDGLMRWNFTRYNKKINSVYKTIVAAGKWSPPAIVGLCEVENRKVLEDLIYGTYLSKYDYGIIHEDSPDERGIDVCLIYRKSFVNIIDFKYWIPLSVAKKDFFSRSVLYAKCQIQNDTIHLIVNHWPSRRGGVLAGESLRMKISEMIREAADSINNCFSGFAKIIIMGDFNCTPDDKVIQTLIKPSGSKKTQSSLSLVNLAGSRNSNASGTYHYMGTWETLDQIIVSEWFLNCKKGLSTGLEKFMIFKPEFLLRKDPKYPGFTTFSTYRGYRYQGGFSDHLPVLLDLEIR